MQNLYDLFYNLLDGGDWYQAGVLATLDFYIVD